MATPFYGVQQSRYNITMPLTRRRTLAYNSLSGNFAVWEALEHEIYNLCGDTANTAAAMELAGNDRYLQEVVDNLKKGRFIVAAGTDEKALFNRAVTRLRNLDRQMTVTIAPTLACNFACDYCYQGEDVRTRTMTPEVEQAIVDYMAGKMESLDRLGIAWYGGEPLLRPDILFRLSDRFQAMCRDRGVVYTASIVTNGYLLEKEVAARLIDAGVTVAQVTLDGDREIHDARRMLRGGGATFATILDRVLEAAEQPSLTIQIRVNIDNRNRDSVPALLERLTSVGLSGKKNFGVYFAPVDICSNECLRVIDSVMDMREYAALESDLIAQAIDYGLAVASMPIRLFSLCAAVRKNGFVFLPDGAVHKCWNDIADPEAKICDLSELDSVEDNIRYRRWLDDSLFTMPECESCAILANCSGGCFNKAKMGYASPCISLKYNVKDRLVRFALSKDAIRTDDLVGESHGLSTQ
ncbi:MAG: radical SAM protein [Planctomycetes bacterium]|nr:radical SAM protein [Planctomycetota bacterium]